MLMAFLVNSLLETPRVSSRNFAFCELLPFDRIRHHLIQWNTITYAFCYFLPFCKIYGYIGHFVEFVSGNEMLKSSWWHMNDCKNSPLFAPRYFPGTFFLHLSNRIEPEFFRISDIVLFLSPQFRYSIRENCYAWRLFFAGELNIGTELLIVTRNIRVNIIHQSRKAAHIATAKNKDTFLCVSKKYKQFQHCYLCRELN